MNMNNARAMLNHAAQLIELSATFQTRYGRDYAMKPGSPADAWELYDAIFTLECQIGRLLDANALENLHHRHGEWWKRQDVMDTATAREILEVTGHLIACCARVSANQTDAEWSYAIKTLQQSIAGMLPPASLQVAMDESIQLDAV
ncbi:MAG: hypothetical protein OHK0046_12580 [Anaerolineae bacterium]